MRAKHMVAEKVDFLFLTMNDIIVPFVLPDADHWCVTFVLC